MALRVWTLGSKAGEVETLGVGRYALGVQREYHKFPIFKQNYVWTRDKAEGLTINIDIGIEFFIDSDNNGRRAVHSYGGVAAIKNKKQASISLCNLKRQPETAR